MIAYGIVLLYEKDYVCLYTEIAGANILERSQFSFHFCSC